MLNDHKHTQTTVEYFQNSVSFWLVVNQLSFNYTHIRRMRINKQNIMFQQDLFKMCVSPEFYCIFDTLSLHFHKKKNKT